MTTRPIRNQLAIRRCAWCHGIQGLTIFRRFACDPWWTVTHGICDRCDRRDEQGLHPERWWRPWLRAGLLVVYLSVGMVFALHILPQFVAMVTR